MDQLKNRTNYQSSTLTNGNSQGPNAPNKEEPKVNQAARAKDIGVTTDENTGTTHYHSVH